MAAKTKKRQARSPKPRSVTRSRKGSSGRAVPVRPLGILQILTPANRRLLALMRAKQPKTIAELAQFAGRAAPNVTRTIDRMVAAGLVRIEPDGNRRAPRAIVKRIVIELDPYDARRDQVRLETERIKSRRS